MALLGFKEKKISDTLDAKGVVLSYGTKYRVLDLHSNVKLVKTLAVKGFPNCETFVKI